VIDQTNQGSYVKQMSMRIDKTGIIAADHLQSKQIAKLVQEVQ
jgi:hypothetical protein